MIQAYNPRTGQPAGDPVAETTGSPVLSEHTFAQAGS
jgi:hypothetical protein